MPSVFARNRRASDPLNSMPFPDDSQLRQKRGTLDGTRPPVSASGKFRSFLAKGEVVQKDEGKKDSLRKRLTSPSTFFHKNATEEQLSHFPASDVPDGNPTLPPGAAPPNGAYSSPRPDSVSASRGAPSQGSASAQPSYLVNDGFDASSDGRNGMAPKPTDAKESLRKRLSSPSTFFHKKASEEPSSSTPASAAPDRSQALPSGAAPSRSAQDRSLLPKDSSLSGSASPEVPSPRRESASWQPSYPTVVDDDDIPSHGGAQNTMSFSSGLNENAQRRAGECLDTPSPEELSAWPAMKSAPKPITPPETVPTPPPSATSQGRSHPASPGSGRRPSLSLNLDPSGSLTAEPARRDAPAVPLNNSSASTPSTAAHGSVRPRPDMPVRRITLIQSPPMPQPIKNLPTLAGWQGLNKESGGQATPSWGVLAKEGGPRTPGGFGGMQSNGARTPGLGWVSPGGPRTPNVMGFPFSTTSVVQNRSKEKSTMSEEELRRAKRAMPVMFREPSFRPQEDHDGGEAGDSDESDDSETEMEHDSDRETETEPAVASKARKPFVPTKSKLAGKGKGKANQPVGAAPSSLASSSVPEEDDGSPRLGSAQTQSRAAALGKSFWSLPPLSNIPADRGSWMQFGSGSPLATPQATKRGPSAASRNNSNIDSIRSGSTNSGYFDSQPASSTGSPRQEEPMLLKGTGQEIATSQRAAFGLGPVLAGQADPDPRAQQQDEGDEGDDSDDGSLEESHSTSNHDDSGQSPATVNPMPGPDKRLADTRPSIYSRNSQSLVNLSGTLTQPQRRIDADIARREDKASATPQLASIRSREEVPNHIDLPPRTTRTANGLLSPNLEWAKPPPTPAAGLSGFTWGKGKDEVRPSAKRRRSADDLLAPPPEYAPPLPGTFIPRPRDEEGKEKLPEYWCAVHIEGNLSRKMEFTAPGIQARDRGWKKIYCILRGTQLLVYKFDPHRYPIKETAAPIPTVTEAESEEHLHVHVPGEKRDLLPPISIAGVSGPRPPTMGDGTPGARRGSGSGVAIGQNSPGSARRTSTPSINTSASTSSSEKDASLFSAPGTRRASVSTTATSASSSSAGPSSLASHFQHNSLTRNYTLQNSESGLAADYMKRKNVVRVRAEGEQFLVQTENAREVVDWIEAFQAAGNVALDLDDRPMPKIITLPRRRRRRPLPGALGTADANPPVADTPEGNAAAVRAAEAGARDRERMLAEDQAQGEA